MPKATSLETPLSAGRLGALPDFADTVPWDSLPSEGTLHAAIAREVQLKQSLRPSAGHQPAHEATSGMPADRAARIAARRAFVEMKQIFMRSVAHFQDRKGLWLRSQVRLANDPMDLWLLRGPVLAALRDNDSATRHLRADLYRGLDSLFPDAFSASQAARQPLLPEPWAIWAAAPAHHGLRR